MLLFIASVFLNFNLLVCKLEHCTFDDVLDLMQFNNKMSGSDSCYEVSKAVGSSQEEGALAILDGE